MFPNAVESDGCGFKSFGGNSYFLRVLSSVNSPFYEYPKEGNIEKLFIKVPFSLIGDLLL